MHKLIEEIVERAKANRQRIVLAARQWLARQASMPRCRFDAVLVEQGSVQWLEAAFDAE